MDISLLFVYLVLVFSYPSYTYGGMFANGSQPSLPIVQQACQATDNQTTCVSMLTGRVKVGGNSKDVIQAALSVSVEYVKVGQGMMRRILIKSFHDDDVKLYREADSCLEGLIKSEYRVNSTKTALDTEKLRDARTWASAALSYQTSCLSGLKTVKDPATAINDVITFLETNLTVSTCTAVKMLWALEIIGPDTKSWITPRSERQGFWEPIVHTGSLDPKFNFSGLKADVTVCKDGSHGCYKTVQEAVDAAPAHLEKGKRFVIKINEGVYEEMVNVGFNKTNLVLLGDGIGKTIITGNHSVGIGGGTTFRTATVGISGDRFMASGLTIQNTAGPNADQATAFRSSSDLSFIENCEFLGNQDTLYAYSLRQLYKSCRIEGNVDFIFGNGAAVFQNCTILIRPRLVDPAKGEKNAIAAHARTDPAQNTGFVFLGCLINGTDDYMKMYHSMPKNHQNYLGRPWKIYSRTIYIGCTIEELISPEGWMPWNGEFALTTLFYGEFGNFGAGANRTNRVAWSNAIPEEHVAAYSARSFLQGDEWIATTFDTTN